MGFDLYSIQKDIQTYLETTFPAYQFERGGIPDDQTIIRVNGKIKPYVVLRFRPIEPRGDLGSFGGVRMDDYFSAFDLNAIAATEDSAAQVCNIMTDRLIGYQAVGATKLKPQIGVGQITIRNAENRPTAYAVSQRFTFGLNVVAPSDFIEQPTP